MKRRKRLSDSRLPALVLLAAALASVTCSLNAPHDNPRDPALGGNIEGRLLTRRALPIRNARVEVLSHGLAATTDTLGRFSFYALSEGEAKLLFSADSFVSDSVLLNLRKGRIDSITVFLNGKPYLDDCRVTTHVYGRSWPPEPAMFCRLAASAGDRDGANNVDSVWAELSGLALSHRLLPDTGDHQFSYTLWADELPEQNIELLIGRDIVFQVADYDSASTKCIARATRIIRELPELIFPSSGLDTLSTDTLLIWHRYNVQYPVRYYGEVMRIVGGGPGGLAGSFSTGRSTDTTFLFSVSSLAAGYYYWTIEAIDSFGNSVRSREELFRVQ